MAERRLSLLALLERMSCKAKVYILSDIDQHGRWMLP
jgi:5S rRNA maturation endonuclease (ribonuclease M5)